MTSKFDSSQLYTCENCGKSFQTNKTLKDQYPTIITSQCDIKEITKVLSVIPNTFKI